MEEYDDEDDYIRYMGELEKEEVLPEESDEEVLSHKSKGNSSVETFALYSSDGVCSYESTTSGYFPDY
ncbi:Oidioi.mRNA.OKI2018_I69.XSR.g14093.t1.cds [Oikopleura dioica]|uniref:Oidioi.mRNA.OKI2018_I69.XSR.g14093.t1.cds n=1 Tax=Oikopleura dioica TaxID=34765 RepID=A0ABN7SCP9_OIKDI|nr:Oidioi.mRNA.OKI2018_I69.XSR.g14093.t1.cds [Oikopleura dioica]